MDGEGLERPVVVHTSCDRITQQVLKALLPCAPLAFAESEEVLHQRVAQGARLVVLHLRGCVTDSGRAGRLVRAVPASSAPVVALWDADSGDPASAPAELLDDVLRVKTERWQALLQLWATWPEKARHRVAALRLVYECAPVSLLHACEKLMLMPVASLSVKKWSANEQVGRTHLYRDLKQTGMTPARLVDIVRCLHYLAPVLSDGATGHDRKKEWSTVRTERRVLNRSLGLTQHEISGAGEPGSPEVRNLVSARLRESFARRSPCIIPALPS